MCCPCHRISRANKKKFHHNKLQQSCTYIQKAHNSSSVKHKSRSTTKKLANIDDITDTHFNKVKVPRPDYQHETCHFSIYLVFSKKTNHWYMRYNGYLNTKSSLQHRHHLPLSSEHLAVPVNDLDDAVLKNINTSIEQNVEISKITRMIENQFGLFVSPSSLYKYKEKNMVEMLQNTCNDARISSNNSTAADKVITYFQATTRISFIYVLHDIDSGFVTMKSNNITKTKSSHSTHLDQVGVSMDDIKSWRSNLKVSNSEQILVSLAWCHDEDLRLAKMHPYFIACDMTFGLNKEGRNLLTYTGIDGNNELFTLFNCFMPSKQCLAYHWAHNTAARYLLTDSILERNRCIATDNEKSLFDPIRLGMKRPYLRQSKHRLDQYHMFSQDWYNINSKFSSKEKKAMLSGIYDIVQQLFGYVESEDESKLLFIQLQNYYDGIKDELKNEDGCNLITKLLSTLETNVDHISHHSFKNVTSFDFRGDSIAESSYSIAKYGSQRIASNSTMNTCAKKLITITENRGRQKDT